MQQNCIPCRIYLKKDRCLPEKCGEVSFFHIFHVEKFPVSTVTNNRHDFKFLPNCRFQMATISCNPGFYNLHNDNTHKIFQFSICPWKLMWPKTKVFEEEKAKQHKTENWSLCLDTYSSCIHAGRVAIVVRWPYCGIALAFVTALQAAQSTYEVKFIAMQCRSSLSGQGWALFERFPGTDNSIFLSGRLAPLVHSNALLHSSA